MLLVIDDSIAAHLEQADSPRGDVLDALHLVAHAYRKGTHLIYGSLPTLRSLAGCPHLDERTRKSYSRMSNHFPQMQAYLRRLVRRLELVAEEGVFELVDCGSYKAVRVSAGYFSRSCLYEETVVLCENQKDTVFYRRIAQVYLARMGAGMVTLRCEPRGGGGQTTADEFAEIQDRKERLCLCIADSDRRMPGGPLGGTARAVKDLDDPGQPLCTAVALDVRMAENLVPTEMYRELSKKDASRTPGLIFLQELESSAVPDARRHVNLKHGLVLGEVLHAPPGSPVTKYWTTVLRGLGASRMMGVEQCWSGTACSKKDECKCVVGPGLGQNVLEGLVKDVLDVKSAGELATLVSASVVADWNSIGEMITAWCCGSVVLSTV